MKYIKTLEQFESETKENPLLVLKVSASWCEPCQRYTPIIKSVSNSRSDVTIAEIDIDDIPSLSDKFDVRSVPTLVILKNGQHIDSLVGSKSTNTVHAWIDHAINS